jgi:hypothetical protein
MKRSLLFVAWLVFQAGGLAATTQDLFKELRAELQAAALAGQQSERGVSTLQELENAVNSLEPFFARDTSGLVDQLISSAPNDKVRQLSRNLGLELKKEQAVREAAAGAAVKKEISDALHRFLDAKNARDMDAPLADMIRLSREQNSSTRNGGEVAHHLQQAREVVSMMRSVQDSLSIPVPSVGDNVHERVLNAMRTPFAQSDFAEYVPRSEMIEKLRAFEKLRPEAPKTPKDETDQQVGALLAGVKNLDQLAAALEACAQIRLQPQSYWRANLEEARGVSRVYDEIKRGQATSFSTTLAWNRSSMPSTAQSLHEKLIAYALPRVLQLPPEVTLKPDETILTFLQHTLSRAQKERNWLLVSRVLDAGRSLRLQIAAGPTDSQALLLFLAGNNLERARQYAPAVNAYLATLKTGSQVIPAEHLGELLDGIKKSHPEEFEQGTHPEAGSNGPARSAFPQVSGMTEPPSGVLTVPAAPEDAGKASSAPPKP